MVGGFGKKPSDTHVIWTNREAEGKGKKKFDFDYLAQWADRIGADYETRHRVDHERADEPRDQHLVVFNWAETKGETFEIGDKEWEMSQQKTPRTFLEIDTAGDARIKSWSSEMVLDIRELWLDGPAINMKTPSHGKRAIDARKLLSTDGDGSS